MQRISWHEWGDSAFEEAYKQDKPVLLAISAAWCHWCHVMDDKTYSDPKVIEIIERDFIPIRADSDNSPDINTRYNMGGWPSTVFLNSEHDILTGTTYVPPDRMIQLLEHVASGYHEQKAELQEKARESRTAAKNAFLEAKSGVSNLDDVNRVLDIIRAGHDDQYGGFGSGQKFPHPSALELLLFSYEQTGDYDDLHIASDTLLAMINGDIFDPVEGGMFRYAAKRDWTSPHYEKILLDNARIASVLLDAYRVTDEEIFLSTAKDVFSYIEKTLLDKNTGVLYGSQDADEEYYLHDANGRKLLAAPPIDHARYTDANAILAESYLKLYGIGKDIAARDKALRIVGYFNNLKRTNDGIVCHYIENGKPHGFGNFSDCAALVLANVLCCEATGDVTYIRAAQELLESIFSAFGSDKGAFFDISATRAKERGFDRFVIPMSENMIVAKAFIKLADLTEDEAYRLSARKVLDWFAGQFTDYGIVSADYALAVAALNVEPLQVTVNAMPGTEEADLFIQSSLGKCGINCTVRTVAQEAEEPFATICLGAVCRTRVTDPDDLVEGLSSVVAERSTIP